MVIDYGGNMKKFILLLALIQGLIFFSASGCKKDDEDYKITKADVEYISKIILTMLHSAQEDAIYQTTSNLPIGQLSGPIDWTGGDRFDGIRIQGTFQAHTDYSSDALTDLNLSSVDLDPFDSKGMNMEIKQGVGTIGTHIDKGWLQDDFKINLTLRIGVLEYFVVFPLDTLYFDMQNMRITGDVIFDEETYNLNISFIPASINLSQDNFLQRP